MTGGYQPRGTDGPIARPPSNPSGVSQEEQATERFPYRELIQRMTSFSPTGGCRAVLLPAGTPLDQCQKIADALRQVMPMPTLVICGDLQALDEADMNAAGWYRA